MPAPEFRRGVNDFSLGIELIATAESGYTDEQYDSCACLCSELEKRHGIAHFVGHQDIAGKEAVALGLRQDIKDDPGAMFDWKRFHGMRHKK
jgi:N-acetyl-anhydromuramyl-L-alanine amidase AmpD